MSLFIKPSHIFRQTQYDQRGQSEFVEDCGLHFETCFNDVY